MKFIAILLGLLVVAWLSAKQLKSLTAAPKLPSIEGAAAIPQPAQGVAPTPRQLASSVGSAATNAVHDAAADIERKVNQAEKQGAGQ